MHVDGILRRKTRKTVQVTQPDLILLYILKIFTFTLKREINNN